jgi:dephospho-CoA kinase
LLFEAGLDRECDAVIFVDVDREERLRRVRAGRGWDEPELKRREAAQIGLEEKKARSTHVVSNMGDLVGLQAELRQVLDAVVGPAKA